MAYEILDISSFLTLVCQFVPGVLIAVVVVHYGFYDNVVSVRVSRHISKKLIRNMHRFSLAKVFQRKEGA